MKAIINFRNLAIILSLCCMPLLSQSQVEVSLTVLSANVSTTCTDGVFGGDPDIFWQVDVAGEGAVTYPGVGACFNAVPNQQYLDTLDCFLELPDTTIEVCFTVFENDGIVLPGIGVCELDETCVETICQEFALPTAGTTTNYSLSLPAGGTSEGTLEFSITSGEDMSNNLICNAIDLGVLTAGGVIGDASQGIYDNYCTDNVNDISTEQFGIFADDFSCWFKFTTGPDIGPEILMNFLNDPENTGDPIDLQVAVFTTLDGSCTGQPILEDSHWPINSEDAFMDLRCVQPNTTYYIMVDAGYFDPPEYLMGVFGFDLVNVVATEAGDTPCEAEYIGIVPEGGTASLDGFYSNFCADGTGDVPIPAFGSQASVWVSFTPPSSGHVIVEALSEPGGIDPLDIQMAVLRTTNDCNGFFIPLESGDNAASPDQTLEVSCLYDDQEYYILIDGAIANLYGTFTVNVTDAGDITPMTVVDTVICAGDTYQAGTSVYSETGTYLDTIQLFFACDSIVESNLTVLDPIEVTIQQTLPAVLEGGINGEANISAIGGTGNYNFDWCTGETGPTATMLVGGEECCVTVTDDLGCEMISCFTVDFVVPIEPVFENDSLLCFGDTDGLILFAANEGYPPYEYVWEKSDGTISGSGTISAEGEEVQLPNLPAGDYNITITDQFFDTTFVAEVYEPSLLELEIVESIPASCFAFCDGMGTVAASGGTPPYNYVWPNGMNAPTAAGLCAGEYLVTVTDDNNCMAETLLVIEQPEEFIATAVETQSVSCFEGTDGQASVNTNGNAIAYEWDTGDDTQLVDGLATGTYEVTVTNEDGCLDTTFVEITQPDSPVEVDISLADAISCAGEADGILEANVSGPGFSFNYNWSSGSTNSAAQGLPTGDYSVTVTNERGCEATNDFFLDEPAPINAMISPIDITCLDPDNGGIILIDTVTGGTGRYEYSIDGIIYSNASGFFNLFAGTYDISIRDEEGCESIFPVTVMGPPELVVSLGEDIEITQGETIEIEALTNIGGELVFSWTPRDTINAGADNMIEVQPIESTVFQVVVEDTVTLCTATDQINVVVNRDRKIFVPNVFSPNNDGSNDVLMIQSGVGVEEIESYRIFDRNGALVYEQTNFQPNDPYFGWDGRFRGQDLNTGVYVYVAEIRFIDGLTEVFKGDVLLMR